MRYYVESYGCTMNFGEGRKLSEDMASLGYSESETPEDADIVILNTCTVVETTEKRMLSRISELKRAGKEVIVTGCMAKAQPQRIEIRLPDSLVIPPRQYHRFAQAVADKYGSAGPPIHKGYGPSTILPIAQGCLGNCSYCITRMARGKLSSYPEDEILEEFRRMVASGTKEVLLTAQDTACYGFDSGTDLAELLGKMLETEGDYKIRIGMMNPNHLMKISDSLVETMNDDRVYKFLHIPVQSGSDSILRSMRRGYTAEEFMSLVESIRSICPGISIATDVITGYPGETDADHEMTKDLIRRLKADTLNITRFSPRPGTDASKMPQIHGRISKERSTELTELKNEVEYEVNSKMVGKTYRAMATEKKDGTIMRTSNYRPVVIPDDIPLGTTREVTVVDCRSTYLIGKTADSETDKAL
ncbi:MAG: tRNA (N(6)-L-threonylcarbamoyladenosine(37)-C(2))-methylthiotransferase [Candidatus Methanomethylophilaceae archaeon]|nr:tRNA (N(6)-L-threonylcarbamoyladenosine(37)-C(2))-methylthiotransferase [Candidatus Methanomethylophilaceae archaeon]